MSASTAHEIGIVDYPGAQVACILGLTDLFGVASTIALDQRRSGQTWLRVTRWKPIDASDANLSCIYDSAPRDRPRPRTLIIPPTLVNLPDPDVHAGVVSWVRNRHAAGATLVSLCSGAFILAETGLADGQSVSTHQICAKALAKRFPQIVVDVNRRIIDHGDIITAGGFLSWVDLGLFLVDRILGPAIRAETARFVLDDPAAGEARTMHAGTFEYAFADRIGRCVSLFGRIRRRRRKLRGQVGRCDRRNRSQIRDQRMNIAWSHLLETLIDRLAHRPGGGTAS